MSDKKLQWEENNTFANYSQLILSQPTTINGREYALTFYSNDTDRKIEVNLISTANGEAYPPFTRDDDNRTQEGHAAVIQFIEELGGDESTLAEILAGNVDNVPSQFVPASLWVNNHK